MKSLKRFIEELLTVEKLTMNEISILLELGMGKFTRDELLLGSKRVKQGVYEAAALTRTLQKLLNRNPAWIGTSISDDGKTEYVLLDPCDGYGEYQKIITNICHTRYLTLNIMKLSLKLIEKENNWNSARSLAIACDLTDDYMAGTVLPRAYVLGIVEKKPYIELDKQYKIEDTERDRNSLGRIEEHQIFFKLNLDWIGDVQTEKWL